MNRISSNSWNLPTEPLRGRPEVPDGFFGSEPDEDPDLYSLLEDVNLYWADDVAYL